MIKNKLSFKLAFWILGVSFFLTIFTSLFYLKHEYDNKYDNFKKLVDTTHKNKERILELSLWHYDTIALQGILEDIVDSRAITYAYIMASDNNIFEKGIKKDKKILEKEFIFRKESNGHVYTIGKLYMQGNLDYINDEVLESAFHMIFFELLKVIIMSFFALTLMQKLFIYRMSRLSKYALDIHLDNLDTPFDLESEKDPNKRDELDIVVHSFNVMKDNLSREIHKSNKIQQELYAFRQAVEQSYNSIVITDTKRRIIYVNDVFEKITGYTKEEVLYKNPNILKPNNAHALYYKQMNATLNKGEVWEGELVNIKKDGSFFYEKASIMPIFLDGKLVNYLAIKQDITDYKESLLKINKLNVELEQKVEKRTEELANKNSELTDTISNLEETQAKLIETEKVANSARKDAENANREKSMLLANISHELKTPLNGIKGLVYLTKLKTKNQDITKNLTSIDNYSETLLRMISDLLDVSKLDAKKITIENQSFNLLQVLQSMQEIYEHECQKKKIKFIFNCCSSIPEKVIGDATRIHQVLTNLLNNAIKFTNVKKGFVQFDIVCDLVDENNIRLTFSVEDNGIGIKQEDLKTIFDPFYQTKESLNHYAGGSGLGLNISKNIIEQMDGIIRVESQLGEGSKFFVTVSFPIDHTVEEKFVEGLPHKSFSNKSQDKLVLVVDDNQINLDVMEGIFSSINTPCVLAKNGLEALKLIENHVFDLVVTDIKMPVMNGCELILNIRKQYNKEELPIIIVSANEDNHCDECNLHCDTNGYIKKPIDPEKFLDNVSYYIDVEKTYSLKENEQLNSTDINKNILDIENALKRFIGNEKLYKTSLKDFITDTLNSPFKINQALENNEINEAIDHLHTIKGLSGNLSAKSFAKTARELHDALKFGHEYKELFRQYEKELEQLENTINIYLDEQSNNLINVDQEVLTENELNDFLQELLPLTQTYNTKALKCFDTLPENLESNAFLESIKKHLQNYEFKEVSEKIEKFFAEHNSYTI